MADTFEITGQQEVLDVSDVMSPVRAMSITFRSKANGVAGTVRIPLTDYTPTEAARRIGEYVANIDAVHEL